MKTILNKCFKWEPKREALIGFVLGSIIVVLSVLMVYTNMNIFLTIFIRDGLMILLCGIAIPLAVISKENSFRQFGLHFDKWFIFLAVNFVLAGLLLFIFLKEVPIPADFVITETIFFSIIYIMLAGIFETVVFYSFIRTTIERSFGIIPAIVAASLFYSFHHAGFQPEFTKLIFVGIMYASIFRIGNSALLIFPFFWGVGGCYDVLIQSQVVAEIQYPAIRSLILSAGMIGIILFLVKQKRLSKDDTNAIAKN